MAPGWQPEKVLIFVDDIIVGADNIQRHLAAGELYAESVVARYSSSFEPASRAGPDVE